MVTVVCADLLDVAMLQKLGFQPRTFKLKVAESTFNDETRVKKSIIGSAPMDFVKENKARTQAALHACLAVASHWEQNDFAEVVAYLRFTSKFVSGLDEQ